MSPILLFAAALSAVPLGVGAAAAEATGVDVIERKNDGAVIVVVMKIDRTRQFDYQGLRFYMADG